MRPLCAPPAQIMVASTATFLSAARFGLAPSVKKVATAGLKLVDREVPFVTNDPAGAVAARRGLGGHLLIPSEPGHT